MNTDAEKKNRCTSVPHRWQNRDGIVMNSDDKRFDWITEKIIGCAYKVGSKLGCGFLENCYENALAYELKKSGLREQQQVRLKVWYDDIVVGEYVADLI